MRIELPVDAHLPTDYVESERLRLEMYRQLASAYRRGHRGGAGLNCWFWPRCDHTKALLRWLSSGWPAAGQHPPR